MTTPSNARTSPFPMTADDLRRDARAAGREVWEQVGDMNLYTSFDRPGVVLTREDVRANRNTLMLHTSSDALQAPF